MNTAAAAAPCVQPVLPADRSWPLHDVAQSRALEAQALRAAAPHALMARAGAAVARLAMAVAPHARMIWIVAGPGNNGGDGLVAARLLHAAGRPVRVSLMPADPARQPEDARRALADAQAAGVPLQPWPAGQPDAPELCIDALLGLGARRAPASPMAAAIDALNRSGAPVLAVDLPSGLDADNGAVLGDTAVRARHTLSLLTLRPGLFTHLGRDHAGQVWLDALGVDGATAPMQAMLTGADRAHALLGRLRDHAGHKGRYGDVLVLGGATGMAGAGWLAARAALRGGAGRVHLALLDAALAGHPDPLRPEVMPRQPAEVVIPPVLQQCTVVSGCGGGQAIARWLPGVLHHAARLVLDADALNAIAGDPALQRALARRGARAQPTVLTPHPLEAARLLGLPGAAEVQAQRLHAAQELADRSGSVVVLKGSGTVIAAPGHVPCINASGNARLATAGSGDVLAGWIGALLAPHGTPSELTLPAAFDASAAAVWLHGRAAEGSALTTPLPAADLIETMARTQASLRTAGAT